MASPVPPQREGLLVWVQVCSRSARSARRENRRTHARPPTSRLGAAPPPRAPAPNPPPPRARRNAPSVACAQVASRTYSPAWDESFELVVAAVWNVITVRVRHAARADAPSRQDTTIGMVCVPLGGVVSWRGVTSGADGRFKAIYRPLKDPGRFKFCTARDPATGQEADSFATAEEAAQAYDATALATDGEEAALNFAGRTGLLGAHAREAAFPLAGANGLPVLGVQASPGAPARAPGLSSGQTRDCVFRLQPVQDTIWFKLRAAAFGTGGPRPTPIAHPGLPGSASAHPCRGRAFGLPDPRIGAQRWPVCPRPARPRPIRRRD